MMTRMFWMSFVMIHMSSDGDCNKRRENGLEYYQQIRDLTNIDRDMTVCIRPAF